MKTETQIREEIERRKQIIANAQRQQGSGWKDYIARDISEEERIIELLEWILR